MNYDEVGIPPLVMEVVFGFTGKQFQQHVDPLFFMLTESSRQWTGGVHAPVAKAFAQSIFAPRQWGGERVSDLGLPLSPPRCCGQCIAVARVGAAGSWALSTERVRWEYINHVIASEWLIFPPIYTSPICH